MCSTKKYSNSVYLGRLKFLQTIGGGTFAKVKVAEDNSTGEKVAIKILNRKKIQTLDVVDKIKHEICHHQCLNHPHVIKLFQVICTPSDIFMIMEYVSGGDLYDFIVKRGKLVESEARLIFQQIISGVSHLHKQNVVHRDLKPENILLDAKNNIKIADFGANPVFLECHHGCVLFEGLSHLLQDGELLQTSCGSPNYAAPEVVTGQLYIGPEVDIWSCGIILYALLCGTLPFDHCKVEELFKIIRNGVFTIPRFVNLNAAQLIRGMLQINPSKRHTTTDIVSNQWFEIDLPVSLFLHRRLSSNPVTPISVAIESFDLIQDNLGIHEHEINEAVASDPTMDAIVVAEMNRVSRHLLDHYSATNHPRSPTKHIKANRHFRWHLGIRASSKCEDVMLEIYRVLLLENFEWKVIREYKLLIRLKSGKAEINNLFQIKQLSYLVDFKLHDLSSLTVSSSNLHRSSTCSRDFLSRPLIIQDMAPAPITPRRRFQSLDATKLPSNELARLKLYNTKAPVTASNSYGTTVRQFADYISSEFDEEDEELENGESNVDSGFVSPNYHSISKNSTDDQLMTSQRGSTSVEFMDSCSRIIRRLAMKC